MEIGVSKQTFTGGEVTRQVWRGQGRTELNKRRVPHGLDALTGNKFIVYAESKHGKGMGWLLGFGIAYTLF